MLATNVRAVERQLGALASEMTDVTLLQTVPGVGVITATALVALVADIRRFPSGRHLANSIHQRRPSIAPAGVLVQRDVGQPLCASIVLA